jgi:hypothetical protein
MARKPKKPKGPGTGRPGIPRKYAKEGQQAKPKTDDDQALKDAMQSLRASQDAPQGHQPTQENPQEPDIDFTAALGDNPNSPLVDNNIYINNKEVISHRVDIDRESINRDDSDNQQPKSKKVKDDKILIPEILDDNQEKEPFELKSQLTIKELKFIELYLSGNYTQVIAMNLAGYEGYNQKYLEILARKIIGKYELQAGDHRKIMRAMGFGEVKILELLIDSATKARSETVKLNARIALAKAIGIQKEAVEGVEGITIIFEGPKGPQGQPPGPGQAPPAAPQPPHKVRMIK